MREKTLPMPTVTAMAGFITLASALWWALLGIGICKDGVHYESVIWMAAFRSLPFICLIPTALLPYIFIRGGCRNPAIFCCGMTAGLLPLVALFSNL
jgi:hypothetical protein